MAWTTDLPMKTGWYWWRRTDGTWVDMGYVEDCGKSQKRRVTFLHDCIGEFVQDLGGEWQGPLVPHE